LIQGWDGNLYGTTVGDGTNNFGAIFSVTTNATVNWSFSFSPSSFSGRYGVVSAFPYPTLIQASDRNLYGTIRNGGSYGSGAIYRITTNGVFTSIYNFTGGSDGALPAAGLAQVADGTFFGTTEFGGPNNVGVIYRLNLGLPPIPMPPVFQSVTLTNGAIALTWSSIPTLSYQLQSSLDLNAGIWSNSGNPILATGSLMTVSNAMAWPQQFYRVLLQPAP